jgi:polyphosphate kinase 2 (PPK2 family)
MLEKIDLDQKLGKKAYKRIISGLSDRLYKAQKASWDAGIPVVILFEGWDAAGKGTSIQKLTSPLDPRGFKLYPIRAARTYEKKRPWLWRFWLKLPARGEWAIFDRSWYGRVMVERVEGLIPENEWRRGYRDIVDFERTLADDGHLFIKFFLHISKQEQRRRYDKLLKDPLNAWHVTAEDWEHHRRYEDWLQAYEEAFERTETEWGPWTIVEATDKRFTWVKIYQTIINSIEQRLGETFESAQIDMEDEEATQEDIIEAELEEELEDEEAEEIAEVLDVIDTAGEQGIVVSISSESAEPMEVDSQAVTEQKSTEMAQADPQAVSEGEAEDWIVENVTADDPASGDMSELGVEKDTSGENGAG